MSDGMAAGDEVDVHIEGDASAQDIVVPTDLADALALDQQARDFFETFAHTHRKEWVRWIEDARSRRRARDASPRHWLLCTRANAPA